MQESADRSEATRLLLAWNEGDTGARDRLMRVVYEELRRLAGSRFAGERRDHILQPTALVNEVYLRLVDQTRVQWRNRTHFFAIAARMMRRILVDHARRRRADKRGGGIAAVTLQDVAAEGMGESQDVDLVALDEALSELQEMDVRASQVVELRFFGGLTVEEVASSLDISAATVKREWSTARAWLFRRLRTGTA